MKNEIWKPIPGYVGAYEVSNLGNVRRICDFGPRSRKPPYALKPQKHNHGYLSVALHTGAVDGVRQQKMFLVHRLVAGAFLEGTGQSVNHKNGDKHDNRVENLEYMTLGENAAHSVANDWQRKGESIGTSKLTEETVREIRKLKSEGVNYKEIAARYGIHQMNVYQVVNYTWQHVK